MKHFLTLLLLLQLFSLHAQSPVITRDNYFEIGDSALFYNKFDTSLWSVTIGPSGEDAFWDFSMVDFNHSSVIVDTLLFIAPEGTPFYPTSLSADYSLANICMLRLTEEFSPENNDYNYYHVNDDSLAFLGHWADNGGSELWEDQFPDPRRELIFPFTYSDAFGDDFHHTYVDYSGSGFHSQTGTQSVTADAFGHMLTPDGELLEDVIRLHIVTMFTDSSMFGEELYTWERYEWYSASRKGAILTFHMAFGDPELVQTAQYQKQTNIITSQGSDIAGMGNGLMLHPNPATDGITIGSEGDAIISLELFDASGRQVMQMPANANVIRIERNGLSSATYLLRATTASGMVFREKIIWE